MLTAWGNLASAYRAAGGAVMRPLCSPAVLPDSERLLEPEHSDTLRARADLRALMSWPSAPHAVTLFDAVLTDSQRALGPSTPTHAISTP
jgi:hypothetical protein